MARRSTSGHFGMRRFFRLFESSSDDSSSSDSDHDHVHASSTPPRSSNIVPSASLAAGSSNELGAQREPGFEANPTTRGDDDAVEILSLDRELPGVAPDSAFGDDARSQVTRGSDPYLSDLEDLETELPQVASALLGAGTFHQYMSNFELHELASRPATTSSPQLAPSASGGAAAAAIATAAAVDLTNGAVVGATLGKRAESNVVEVDHVSAMSPLGRTHSDSQLNIRRAASSTSSISPTEAASARAAGKGADDSSFTHDFSRPSESGGGEPSGSGAAGGGVSGRASENARTEGAGAKDDGRAGRTGVLSPKRAELGSGWALELKLIDFRPDGSHELRSLSRKEILVEARDSMPARSINRRVVAELLQRGATKRATVAAVSATRTDEDDDYERQRARALPSPPAYRPKSTEVGGGVGGSDHAAVEDVAALLQKLGISGASGGKKARSRALRQYLRNELQPRDIRQVDPAFSAKPALWVRHSALVVSLQGVRALICHDRMFLFDPDDARVRKAAKIVEHRLRTDPNVEDVFMPFEFKALEGVLIATVMQLEREFAILEPAFKESLSADWSGNRLTTTKLEQLRLNKQRLSYFQKEAASVQHALQDVLDEDEDMANMYLTEKSRQLAVGAAPHGRDPLDHDEVEVLLEAYLQVIDDLSSKAELLDEAIDDTEDLVGIHLDTLRNRLIMFQLVLSIVGMTFSFGGMVAGFFGMNLPISIFEGPGSEWWFLGVTVMIIIVIVLVTVLTVSFLKWQGLYSSIAIK